ncbi:hypothetical protein VC83_00656 [Pseudogymnoascus destructans]|uniref:Uncharacterized protein n=1 Tax=Pseudogymnoascus destructans TaxID=655981 RepID=A0A177AMV8_9PEZI|nr:uncharacterized protein VC83_00656 [Pseudogymnoascus destructans]OAF63150.1 hypothetical protein VC83_00656 [Pseudogymnoascus destructans]
MPTRGDYFVQGRNSTAILEVMERELLDFKQKLCELSTGIQEKRSTVLQLCNRANAIRLAGIRHRVTEAVDYELKAAALFGETMSPQIQLRDAFLQEHNRVGDFTQEIAKAENGDSDD